MWFEYFFAKRIVWQNQRAVSSLVVKLAILSIALAIAVMEISLSLVQGFETEIQRKVIGFLSHIQIGKYGFLDNMNAEVMPIKNSADFVQKIKAVPQVKSVTPYIQKWALVEAGDVLEILELKGVDTTYDWPFFEKALKQGKLPNLKEPDESLEILISETQARKLKLKVNDKATILFIEDMNQLKRRPVKISGIYNTGLEEFDAIRLFCDMRMLQNVMKWDSLSVMGFEVMLKEEKGIAGITKQLNEVAGYEMQAKSVFEIRPEMFNWLQLQHQNSNLILGLMAIVAVINMASVVLILIIERTRTIGILNALGLKQIRIIRIFLFNCLFLILTGVVIGNILGLSLLAIQHHFQLLKLDPENYFLDYVPVAWVWGRFAFVNISLVILCVLCMIFPASVILRITPIKAIRFQ
ncbi:MAG: ABC transporter permease [Bacteroidia bacterium]